MRSDTSVHHARGRRRPRHGNESTRWTGQVSYEALNIYNNVQCSVKHACQDKIYCLSASSMSEPSSLSLCSPVSTITFSAFSELSVSYCRSYLLRRSLSLSPSNGHDLGPYLDHSQYQAIQIGESVLAVCLSCHSASLLRRTLGSCPCYAQSSHYGKCVHADTMLRGRILFLSSARRGMGIIWAISTHQVAIRCAPLIVLMLIIAVYISKLFSWHWSRHKARSCQWPTRQLRRCFACCNLLFI
jgi:hypothetical protein